MKLQLHHWLAISVLFASILCDVTSSSISVCITNCSQCKQMLGRYFEGQACAEFCIATNGFGAPDCNNPLSVRNFLKRLH